MIRAGLAGGGAPNNALFASVLLLGLLLAAAGRGQSPVASATNAEAAFSQANEEAAFWQAAQQSGNRAEIRAYLDAYPAGRFRALAEAALGPSATPGVTPPYPAPATTVQSRVRASLSVVNFVDGVPLDLDATALKASSNLRLTVVQAGTPDMVADPQRFVEESTPVTAARLHLAVPAGPPGQDEVRLYHIPPFASTYAVAARAPVTVRPGVEGAVLPLELSREASRLGPVRFEALHRGRPLLVQGAFLGLTPRTEWSQQWFSGVPISDVAEQSVVMRLGLPNAAPDAFGSTGEAICVLSVADQRLLDRVTTLRDGEPVLVVAIPTVWGIAGAILLNRCTLRQ